MPWFTWCPAFSSPEPTILLACGRDLWFGPTRAILVPRDSAPFGQHQESRPLAVTKANTGRQYSKFLEQLILVKSYQRFVPLFVRSSCLCVTKCLTIFWIACVAGRRKGRRKVKMSEGGRRDAILPRFLR